MSRHQWLAGSTQLCTCPHQQRVVGCQGFQNHSFIFRQKIGQEAYTTPTSRAFCYQGNTEFSHATDEDDQTS